MAATLLHRKRRRGRDAPAGTAFDLARVDSVVAPDPAPAVWDPPPDDSIAPPLRRVRAVPAAPPREVSPAVPRHISLTSTEVSIPFPDAPPSPSSAAAAVAPVEWTQERGFEPVGRTSRESTSPRAPDSDAAEAAQPDTPATVRYLPAPGPRAESPPQDLVDLVERATGIRVADATIDRSPAVTDRAAAIGAVAFTERATVHLPAELGRSDEPAVRAVIAHELTHVAQQRALGSSLPREDTPHGRELEREALAVQASVGGSAVVRPTYVRRRPEQPGTEPGVQRLSSNKDPYAWQERPESPSAESDVGLGFLGLQVVSNSKRARKREAADEQFRQSFEYDEREALAGRRHKRYRELLTAKQRERRLDALRHGTSFKGLEWDDVVEVRTKLDEEMPYEFGVPHDVDAYPDMDLKPPKDVTATTEKRARKGSGNQRGELQHRTKGSSPSGTSGGTDAGDDAHHETKTADRVLDRLDDGGPSSGEPDYGWQGRDLTGREAATALFGDSFLGALFGKLAGDETLDRKASERTLLESGELRNKREELERKLRHAVLREKRMEMLRAGGDPKTAVWLTTDEIARIRVEVDEEMPVEFFDPPYLDAKHEVGLGASGEFESGTPPADPAAADDPRKGKPGEKAGSPAPDTSTTSTDGQTPPAAPPADDPAAHAAAPTADDHAAPAGDAASDPAHSPPSAAPGAPAGADAGAGTGAKVAGALPAAAAAIADVFGNDDDAPPAESDADAARRIFSAASDLDIEVLTRRLYGRIRRELRSELLIDRERAGALADAR